MLAFSVPTGYRRSKPPARPKLEAFTAIIDRIVEEEERPAKQRHTSKRIFERCGTSTASRRLHDREGLSARAAGSAARGVRPAGPSARPRPGRLRRGDGVIGGCSARSTSSVRLAALGCRLRRGLPAETSRRSSTATAAFSFLGGVPQSILYDNTKLAVGRILGDGKRQRTRTFAELQSHYLFLDRFGRPGKGNDKGKVEGLVGLCAPQLPGADPGLRQLRGAQCASARLLPQAAGRSPARPRARPSASGWSATWPRLQKPLPATPYDACEKPPGERLLAVARALPAQRLLGADRLRPSRGDWCAVT